MSDVNVLPWHDLSRFFREKFGGKVYKIQINPQVPCPHRIQSGGCTFCSEEVILPDAIQSAPPISEQLVLGANALKNKYGACRHVAYFQRGTPAASSPEQLRQWMAPAVAADHVVAIALGTRPDCLTPELLDLFRETAAAKPLFLDLGLQSSHDVTLRRIQRGHDCACFERAVTSLSAIPNAFVIAHLIIGLPAETPAMMMESFRFVADLPVHGVKIHHLQIIAGTVMEQEYRDGHVPVLSAPAYVPILADALEILPWRIVIHRLMGDLPLRHLVAPRWAWRKHDMVRALVNEFSRRKTQQGARSISAGGSLDPSMGA